MSKFNHLNHPGNVFKPARRGGCSARCEDGFTLLELLIVSVLMVFVTALTAEMWRYFSIGLVNLDARSKAVEEMRFALETISADVGSAVGATALGEDRVLFCKDGGDYNCQADWAPPDTMVEYYLSNNHLIRYNRSDGTQITVARVSDFEVENITDELMRFTIRFEVGDVSKQVILMWSKP
ncbi:MAG: type II secretion system protein [Planctomycetes bacterium]|nr:type II secretion system protein [Planctomycetota bacterium]